MSHITHDCKLSITSVMSACNPHLVSGIVTVQMFSVGFTNSRSTTMHNYCVLCQIHQHVLQRGTFGLLLQNFSGICINALKDDHTVMDRKTVESCRENQKGEGFTGTWTFECWRCGVI